MDELVSKGEKSRSPVRARRTMREISSLVWRGSERSAMDNTYATRYPMQNCGGVRCSKSHDIVYTYVCYAGLSFDAVKVSIIQSFPCDFVWVATQHTHQPSHMLDTLRHAEGLHRCHVVHSPSSISDH